MLNGTNKVSSSFEKSNPRLPSQHSINASSARYVVPVKPPGGYKSQDWQGNLMEPTPCMFCLLNDSNLYSTAEAGRQKTHLFLYFIQGYKTQGK